jgi:hypothetical protein
VANPAHPSAPPSEDWRTTLREKGYRLTPQRELVLRAVDRLGHATPDEVLAAVHQESQALNISTVYRTLELLEELGMVRHAHITDAPRRTTRRPRRRTSISSAAAAALSPKPTRTWWTASPGPCGNGTVSRPMSGT